jgi:hypothetical protein
MVISGQSNQCPLYPQKRTLLSAITMLQNDAYLIDQYGDPLS